MNRVCLYHSEVYLEPGKKKKTTKIFANSEITKDMFEKWFGDDWGCCPEELHKVNPRVSIKDGYVEVPNENGISTYSWKEYNVIG